MIHNTLLKTQDLCNDMALMPGRCWVDSNRINQDHGDMALTDENPETESLAPDETPSDRLARWLRFLEEEVWPNIPPEIRGKSITKEEEEEILGYGPDGY